MPLQAIAIPAQHQPAQGQIVALHGWGANAQDLASLSDYLNLPDYTLIFPDAPFPYPYATQGRVWYDFPQGYAFQSDPAFADRPDLQQSRQQLTEWLLGLEAQTQIPLDRTILAGFSQGGAMTLDVGLHLPLAALLVLSGYLHAPPASVSNPPAVFMAHGRQDAVVPLSAAHQARDLLLDRGISVRYHELDMGHEVGVRVLQLMQSFIEETLAPPDKLGKEL